MSQYAVYYNDPNLINTRLDRLMAVTALIIVRAVAGMFRAQGDQDRAG